MILKFEFVYVSTRDEGVIDKMKIQTLWISSRGGQVMLWGFFEIRRTEGARPEWETDHPHRY